jgi:hypothetical protein
MNIGELNKLVSSKLYTKVGMYNYYKSNPELIQNINSEDLVSIPTLAESIGKNGISVIPSFESMNTNDFLQMISEGGLVQLTSDIVLDSCIIITNDVTIDLNGYGIYGGLFTESNGEVTPGDTDSYVFWVKDGGNLTITGEGMIVAKKAKYSMAVWANGGNVIINGGTFMNGEGSDLIYASANGHVVINGGEFNAGENITIEGTKNKFSALNIKDKDRANSSIVVRGGLYYGFNPADNISEGPLTNFVEDGYTSVQIKDSIWRVEKYEIIVDEE